MSAFRAALRISRRDALRFKGRSALIMIMIGLPVLVFTGFLTMTETTDLTPREEMIARLGAVADAAVYTHQSRLPVTQDRAGRFGNQDSAEPDRPVPWTAAEAARLTGGRVMPFYVYSTEARLPDGFDRVELLEIDLRDRLSTGIRTLAEGRFAATPQEIAITPALVGRGVRVGDTLRLTRRGEPKRVVGVVKNPVRPGVLEVVGLYGSVLPNQTGTDGAGWLVETPVPVTWEKVRELNKVGLHVASRAVIMGPRGEERFYPSNTSERGTWIAIGVVLVVTETVLLAGPSFAVGLRRRRRELATIAAQGGSPGHLRAIVLADGLLLGGVAALLGSALGIGVGVGVGKVLARLDDLRSGPVDVPWEPVLGIAALGLVSGLVAAVTPAVQAARQSPARVLAGRPDEVRDRAGRPLLGLVLLVLGTGAMIHLAFKSELGVAMATVVALFGLITLVPWLVGRTGPLVARLPLAARLSVRDAVRHRTRTASAVAAVMAATMGAVTVGMAFTTMYTARQQENPLSAPEGTLVVGSSRLDEGTWSKLRAAIEERLPGASLAAGLRVVDDKGSDQDPSIQLRPGDCSDNCPYLSWSPIDGPVGDERLLALFQGRRDPQAAAALAAGKAVVFDSRMISKDGMVSVSVGPLDEDGNDNKSFQVAAVLAQGAQADQSGGVLPASALTAAGFKLAERRIYAHGVPDKLLSGGIQATDRLNLDLRAVTPSAFAMLMVNHEGEQLTFYLSLAMIAAVILVLGGTFAATGLAAADMRQDLDTLSAVGGRPSTRRLVVAAQAGYIAGLGAVVGLAGGAISGLALARAMRGRRYNYSLSETAVQATAAVPWTFLAALVIGLPLLAALLAGLFTRTRLVLARRVV
ncbi:FtsX-like permease family protein [Nonomuraea sp. NPDC050404]|uniref:FtsX-like permease family protein n=1 Tax=Nonomuraea sp. NPDC050404 TaxID=3155783 RepID=UPI0033F872FA